ncbi:MAG: uncharacterized membrane-anchored protein YjiN (DUF445 family) [Bradyrhizobium sp.]|jgi:uncharacterized membrane-anchored protein YjiN (DUF445 family)
MSETDPLAPLHKIRRIATGLLVLMAVVFVLAHKYELLHPALGFVRAFAEAALVGALADWFAVSALFRHPLGLPIPHTAIIQKNKDRIGVSIAAFLESNFMTRSVVSEEFNRIDFAGAASRWLAVPSHSEAVARQLAEGLPTVLRLVEDDDVRRFIHGRVDRLVEHVRFAPLLADMLTILVADRRHQELFDHLLVMVAGALEKNQDFIRRKIHDNSPRWMPRVFDDQFFERLLDGLQQVLEEMKQPDSQWRERFQESVEELVAQLRVSDDYEVRLAALVQSGLQHPVFRNYVDQIWHDLRQRLLDDVAATDSRITVGLTQALQAVSTALMSDDAVRAKLNDWLRTFAADAVVKRRGAIASLVERVIRQWDGETVSRKFEQYVGRDLQFIRINGTVVGGLVGLILHTVTLML